VLATAVGCLYMMDTDMSFVASKSGLDAAGVLLLVLNMAFVLIMVVLIARAGVEDVKHGLLWVQKQFRACWACFTSPAGARAARRQTPLSMQLQSPGTSCSASRANSTTGLVQPVGGDSGDLRSVEQL